MPKASALRISLLCLTLCLPEALYPCADYAPEPLRIFRPPELTTAIFAGKKADPYYSLLDRLAGSCPEEEKKADRLATNLTSWQQELQALGVQASLPALRQLVYDNKKEELQAGKANLLLANLAKGPGRARLDYLALTRDIEPLVRGNPDEWQPDPARPTQSQADPLIEKALKGAETSERSLSIRYFFQAIRLAHYSGQHEKALQIAGRLPSDLSRQDPLFFEILHLKAGALLKSGKKSQGLLALAEIPARSRQELPRVEVDFALHYATAGALAGALKEASNEIRLQLRLLHFFHDPAPGLEALEDVATLAPTEPLLAYMLLREIDRLEARLEEHLFPFQPDQAFAPRQAGPVTLKSLVRRIWNWLSGTLQARPVGLPAAEKAYIEKLDRFLVQSARQDIFAPDIWQLARAYLAYLRQDTAETLQHLQHRLVQKSERSFVKVQARRLFLLTKVAAVRQVDAPLQKEVLTHYEAFHNTDPADPYACPLNERGPQRRLHQGLIQLHRQAGQMGQALLWEPEASAIDSAAPLNRYPLPALEEALELAGSTDPYTRLAFETSRLTSQRIAWRLGSRHLKQGQAEPAVRFLSQLSTTELDSMYRSERIKAGPFANPFLESFPAGESATSHNALKIAREYQRLTKLAEKKGAEGSQAYYRLGLADFNMSHHGHWWSAVDADWSTYHPYSEKPGDPQLLRARMHFQKALAAGPDRETEAALRYLLAHVSYLDETQVGYSHDSETLRLTETQKTEFSRLAELADTRFFHQVVQQCSYYRKFRR